MISKTEARKQVVEAQLALQVAKDNLAFAGMSRPEKRVAVAKDVLKWIELGKLNPKQMTYLVSDAGMQSCTACALGATFACLTVKTNDLANQKEAVGAIGSSNHLYWNDDDAMRTKLREVFTPQQVANIESAFEGDEFTCDNDTGGYAMPTRKAVEFNAGITDAAERLTRIMKNIIRNGGEFRP